MSKSELAIQALQLELVRLVERVDFLKNENPRSVVVELGQKVAVLESLVADLKKRDEERDRRGWQFWTGVAVVVLTFAANLTINLILLVARKSP